MCRIIKYFRVAYKMEIGANTKFPYQAFSHAIKMGTYWVIIGHGRWRPLNAKYLNAHKKRENE